MSAVGISLKSNTSKAPSLGFDELLDNLHLLFKPAQAGSRITTPTSAEKLDAVIEELSYLNVTGSVEIEKQIATAGGGYCDVFIGYVRRGPNRVKVAVRQLRTFIMLERDFKKLLTKELKLWSSLNHPNILSLYGFIMTDEGCQFSFISEWMEKGRADKFVQANPEYPIHPLILGIANGLAYLHSENIVHGDMKAENILISDTFQPLICDFGISSRAIMSSNAFAVSSTLSGNHLAGSLRWMASELLLPDPEQLDIVPQHTRKTDIWSFGMTVYELLTRQVPYAHIPPSLNPLVLSNITKGVLPILPENLSHDMSTLHTRLWRLCLDCWKMVPEHRPDMEAIINILLGVGVQSTAEGQLPVKSVAAVEHDKDLLENMLADIQHLDMTRTIEIDHYIKSQNFRMNKNPVAIWNSTGIYKAFSRDTAGHQEDITGITVAVKTYKLSSESNSTLRDRNLKELRIWLRLNHKNVLGLLGYIRPEELQTSRFTSFGEFGLPLVSKWMKNGTADTYVKSHPTCDVASIILGAADGLSYLHNKGVIHGSVTGHHILISDSGRALLFDFSCSRFSAEDNEGAPEFSQWKTYIQTNDNFNSMTTKETDVWSFGVTINGLLAARYGPVFLIEKSSLHYSLWCIAEDCQHASPRLRPSMGDIVVLLKKLMDPEHEQILSGPDIHSYLKSDKYGYVFLAWDIYMPPSSASHYVDRERKEKRPIPTKDMRSPSTHPASECMKLILPLRGQGPVELSSSEAVTVEDILRTIYEHYQQKLKTHNIPLRRRAEITSSFEKRCASSLRLGGPEFEKEVRERGICEVDRLDGKVEFESLTLVSAAENAWELHLIRAQE